MRNAGTQDYALCNQTRIFDCLGEEQGEKGKSHEDGEAGKEGGDGRRCRSGVDGCDVGSAEDWEMRGSESHEDKREMSAEKTTLSKTWEAKDMQEIVR